MFTGAKSCLILRVSKEVAALLRLDLEGKGRHQGPILFECILHIFGSKVGAEALAVIKALDSRVGSTNAD